ANPVRCEVGIEIAEVQALLERALVDADAYGAAGTEKVLRLERGTDEEVTPTTGTDAEGDIAEVLLLHGIFDVDLVAGARHFVGLHFHRGEIAQSFQSHLAELDQLAGCRGTLQLAHLTTQHVVRSRRVADKIHAID